MLEACRTCLRLIDVDNSPVYEIEADDPQFSKKTCRYKLLNLIPDMKLNVTPKSMICADCHGSLEAIFEFKAKCLETEQTIINYFRAKPDVDVKNFDLKDVSAFSMSSAGDIENTETSIKYVGIKEEVESSNVDEDIAAVDESITLVKHEVGNYSADRVEIVKPENTVIFDSKENGTGMFECQVCQKSFLRKSRLKSHMLSHTDERPHKCTFCAKSFKDNSTLSTHVKIHSEVKEYECEVCGKKFSRRDSFENHRMVHVGVRNYACEYCDKCYIVRHSLNRHLLSHTTAKKASKGGEKPYRCETCDHRFSSKALLTVHRRKHTGERPYNCTLCDRSYYSYNSHKAHMFTHTKERPYQCETCRKKFASRSSLVVHRKIHSGVRNFECEYCKKLFVHRHDMLKHIMVHTRERPFSCHICKKTFNRKFQVKQHIMKVHKNVKANAVVIEHTSVDGNIKEEIKDK